MPKNLICGFLFVSLVCVLPVSAASAPLPTSPPPIWDLVKGGTESGNYLQPIWALQQHFAEYQKAGQLSGWYDSMANFLSFVGDYAGALKSLDLSQDAPRSWGKVDWHASGTPVPAIQTILAEAGKHQVIFINEAHQNPSHRALTLQLLAGLYAKGYRYFAAETFAEKDPLNQRGYPWRFASGYYTDEPVFGDLARTALKLGYKLVPYESVKPCQNDPHDPYFCQNQRESGQARNLAERIFKSDPQARVLVHAGYGHIDESQADYGWVPMACMFKQLTGIDPWTLDQTEMSEKSSPVYESPFYANTLTRFAISRPTMFLRPDGSFWAGWYHNDYDVLIVHPRAQYRLGRPDWLLMNGLRRLLPLPANICQGQLPCLVQAFVKGEDEQAVPIDQFRIANTAPAALALPKGSFRIKVLNLAGQAIKSYPLEVK